MSVTLKRLSKATPKRSNLLASYRLEQWLNLHAGELVLSSDRAALLVDHLTATPRWRPGAFSSSSRGQCYRAQIFGFLGLPGRRKADPVEKLRFIDGKMKHLTMQFIGLEAGFLTDIEVPITIPKWRVKGSIDGANLPEHWGWELKTSQAFGYFMEKGPSLSTLLQVHTYFLARPDWDKFSIMYWDTRTREWKEFIYKREPQFVKAVKQELVALNRAVDYRRLPEVLNECKKGKGPTFANCSFSHICLGCKDYTEAEANGQQSPPTSVQIARGVPKRYRIVKGTSRVHGRSARPSQSSRRTR